MVKVTWNGDGATHFGGYVFNEGDSYDFDKDDPRLAYFKRHKDFQVGAKKKASSKKKS